MAHRARRRSLKKLGVHAAVVAVGLCALPAVAVGQGDAPDRDLASGDGWRADGAGGSDFAGWSVAGAGDVNGDGVDDVVVGAIRAGNNARGDSG